MRSLSAQLSFDVNLNRVFIMYIDNDKPSLYDIA